MIAKVLKSSALFCLISVACNKAGFVATDKAVVPPAVEKSEDVALPTPPAPPPAVSTPAQTIEVPAPKIELVVTTPANMLKAGGQKLQATAKIKNSTAVPSVVWTIEGPAGRPDIGSIAVNGLYTSPATNDKEFTLVITATLSTNNKVKASTSILILPVDLVFARCTKGSETFPIFADVYRIKSQLGRLPDYKNPAEATKALSVCMENYAVEPRNFALGFPDVDDLIEDFSLQTQSTLVITEEDTYEFRLNSDDGSRLYIDGAEVIDNDGNHNAYGPGPDERLDIGRKEGRKLLKKGDHPLVLNYFQGPKFRIALTLEWRRSGTAKWTYVPRSAFK